MVTTTPSRRNDFPTNLAHREGRNRLPAHGGDSDRKPADRPRLNSLETNFNSPVALACSWPHQNAVIYGAGGGIGGAVARAFAREGRRSFLAGRTIAKQYLPAGDLPRAAPLGPNASFPTSLRNHTLLAQVVEEVRKHIFGIDAVLEPGTPSLDCAGDIVEPRAEDEVTESPGRHLLIGGRLKLVFLRVISAQSSPLSAMYHG